MLNTFFSMSMLSLVVLVIQNSLLVVMTRFSRKNVDADHNYHTSTLVLNQECVKMLMCLVIYAVDDVWRQFCRDFSSTFGVNAVVKETENEVAFKEETIALPPLKMTPAERGDAASITDQSNFQPLKESEMPKSAEAAEAAVGTCDDGNDGHLVVVAFSEEVGASATGLPPAIRRNTRVAVHPPASPLTAGAAAVPIKSTDSMMSRRNKLRFVWMRTRGAAALYCNMLRIAVIKHDTLKLLVPAFLFNLQNFLIFVGLSNLDAVSFQVWSQTKLLSTALFSVWLLHRKLSLMQWLSLVVLTAGVLGAQLGAPKAGSPSMALYTTVPTTTKAPHHFFGPQKQLSRVVSVLAGNNNRTAMDDDEEPQASAMIGIAACVLSGLSSSYAGVYFEKVVKTTSPTLSIRNIQLSIFGIPFAFISMLLLDVFPRWYGQHQCGEPVHWNIFRDPFPPNGDEVFGVDGACPVRPFYFWQRYDHLLTWGLVGVHAFGGLLVAIVVKYADNILKGFATGVAVIVSGMMSSVIWGYKPSLAFVVGAVLVVGSSIMFHKFEAKH